MSKINENKEYFGTMVQNWLPEYKNKYVITGMQQGGAGVDMRIGRVVQVRLEAGDFGSDNILLRHCNDKLQQHTNQSFWLIPDKFTAYLDDCFEGVCLDDSDEYEYSLGQGKSPYKGFIKLSEINENESSPMRDVKKAIYNKLLKMV